MNLKESSVRELSIIDLYTVAVGGILDEVHTKIIVKLFKLKIVFFASAKY